MIIFAFSIDFALQSWYNIFAIRERRQVPFPFGRVVGVRQAPTTFLFVALFVSDDFRRFFNRFCFRFNQLRQRFEECVKLRICHSFFHVRSFLALAAGLVEVSLNCILIITLVPAKVKRFFDNILKKCNIFSKNVSMGSITGEHNCFLLQKKEKPCGIALSSSATGLNFSRRCFLRREVRRRCPVHQS